jgi:predicted metal-binding protein
MTQTISPATLFVCSLCQFSATEKSRNGISGGQYFIDQMEGALTERNLQDDIQIQPVRCMAQCSHPCNVSLAAPGKLTFILSGLSPTTGSDSLAEFCQQYATRADGRVSYRERSMIIRQATAFVLPPLPSTP